MNMHHNHGGYQNESELRLAGPLYLQVASHMRDRVTAGEWTIEQTLPNEIELATHYRVSLGTMRKALEVLARQNLVVRHQGRGTFVQKRPTTIETQYWPLSFGFGDDKLSNAYEMQFSHISVDLAPHSDRNASLIQVPAGSPAIAQIRCLTKIGKAVTALDAIFVSASVCQDLPAKLPSDLTSLPPALLVAMAAIVKCSDKITATVASEEQAASLDIPRGSPVLAIERRALDSTDRAILVIERILAPAHSVSYSTQI